MDGGIMTAMIAGGVTLLGIGVAAGVAVYQITKQARMGLKVELYREILAAVEKQGEAEQELSTKLRVLNSLISVWIAPDQFPGTRPSPNTTWAELNELVHKVQREAAELMIIIERWQIVDTRLDVFGMAFGVALRDIRAAWAPLSHSASAVLAPMEGLPVPLESPKGTVERLRTESEDLLDATSKLSSWVADFQLEVQAVLLSDLFPNPLTHREPLDPEYFVIRLDRSAEIKDYFENRTTWGLEHKVIEARTREAIAQRYPWLQISPVDRKLPN